MKRSVGIILLCVLMSISMIIPAAALSSDGLTRAAVTIDNQKLADSGYLVNGKTMVPMRAIFEALDCTIEWNGTTKTVTAVKGTKVIKLTIDKLDAYIDGTQYTLAAAPVLINSKTYVPLRFIAEALGCEIAWDNATKTASVKTSGGTSGKEVIHQGTINPEGETWSAGTVHIVRGDFLVEGSKSPVLTVEAGAIVRFEKDASICVGDEAPGGLVVEGTAANPSVFTAYIAGAQPGYWSGIKFYNQTMRDKAIIENARIEYAGASYTYSGAIYLDSNTTLIEVLLKNVEIKNSMNAGIFLNGNAKLAAGSENLKINGTISTGTEGGFPIITDTLGSNNLPSGEYKDNEINSVLLYGNGLNIVKSTTWANIGIPYLMTMDLIIEGNSNPTLTIQPGVEVQVSGNNAIYVGDGSAGTLVAVGTADKHIKITSQDKTVGSWRGIIIGDNAGSCKIEYTEIENAGTAIDIWKDLGAFIKNTTIRNSADYAIYCHFDETGTSFTQGLGNQFEGNAQDEARDY